VRLVIGLGNPGKRYRDTAHSLGFEVVEEIARRIGCRLRGSFRFKSRMGRGVHGTEELLLQEPQTYMNNSGSAAGKVARYYKVEPAEMIVVVDDADLAAGRLRVRPGGSSGGHKGLQSLVDGVGSRDFARVRLGIGRGKGGELTEHVLRRFTPSEREMMKQLVNAAAGAVLCAIEEGTDAAMNRYNSVNIVGEA
jgi:PTH1 family peptidyl-tRNA hydrolase